MAIPILLDTDIGTDIDDVYALILAASSPELELRAVTTVNNDVLVRGQIAKRILRLLGRDDVPVALGEGRSLTHGETRGWLGFEGRGIDLGEIDAERDFAPYNADKMIAGAARQAFGLGNPLTIVTIGAMTNLALAMERFPDRVRLAERVVAMASTFRGYGAEQAGEEHNVACDPVAFERVLGFGLPVTLIGLNVTSNTRMDSAQVDEIAGIGGPLAESLAGMHRIWLGHIRRDHSPMHDGLAVAAVFRPDLVGLLPVGASLKPPSAAVVFNPSAPEEVTNCKIAESVDAEAYHALLFDRIMEAVRGAGARRPA
jgi:purine nucleosidase